MWVGGWSRLLAAVGLNLIGATCCKMWLAAMLNWHLTKTTVVYAHTNFSITTKVTSAEVYIIVYVIFGLRLPIDRVKSAELHVCTCNY